MKILGIIGEYNPMHSGHIYHLKKSLEITKVDYAILIMSGNFTQTGNISIINKLKKAEIAIENGFDMVIELPTIYATSSANYFAYNAINLLNNLNCIDYISFGSEENDLNKLSKISEILINNQDKINKEIKAELKLGNNYPLTREKVLSNYLTKKQLELLSKPNNILGLEYLISLKKLNSNIQPILIHRTNNYNDTKINKSEQEFTSATSIRNFINITNNLELIQSFLPENTYNFIKNKTTCNNEDLFKLVKYKILSLNVKELKEIEEVTEGLEYKIVEAINNSHTYEELINNIKSKRYTRTKIKRTLINILLNKTKTLFDELNQNQVSYAHILKINPNSKELLAKICENSKIDIITSLAKYEKDIKSNKLIKNSLKLDILASNIHSLITNDKLNTDYTNTILH